MGAIGASAAGRADGAPILIDRLAFGGEGVGRLDGKVVFVPWTAPGDVIRVAITDDNGRFSRGRMEALVTPSPDRVEPRCPVFGQCGGCQWQHLSYEAQLRWKQEILAETLKRVGHLPDPVVLPIVPAPSPWNYRNRIQVRRGRDGRLGYLKFQSHEVVPVADCPIATESLSRKLCELERIGTPEEEVFEIIDPEDGREPHLAAREDEERFFAQVNSEQNENLVALVAEAAFGRVEPVFCKKVAVVELYCGAGNFTAALAARAGRVIAVEEAAGAVREAERTLREQGHANVELLRGRVEWGMKQLVRRRQKTDILLLDPPRSGAKEILDLIVLLKPQTLVYVSCDPTTLARDLQFLATRGYRLEWSRPIDMFPQTYHIESVSRLVRAA